MTIKVHTELIATMNEMLHVAEQFSTVTSALVEKSPADAEPLIFSREELLKRLVELREQALSKTNEDKVLIDLIYFRFPKAPQQTEYKQIETVCHTIYDRLQMAVEASDKVFKHWQDMSTELSEKMLQSQKAKKLLDFMQSATGNPSSNPYRELFKG